MPRKQILVPVLVAVLSVAFVFVSFLVFVTRGNASLIRKKLKLGAVILSLTGVVLGGCREGEITCYAPILPSDRIEFYSPGVTEDGIYLNLAVRYIIEGTIYERRSDAFSFDIIDESRNEVQSGDIAAIDGAYDTETELFLIAVRRDLPVGAYTLSIYRDASGFQPINATDRIFQVTLNIVNDD